VNDSLDFSRMREKGLELRLEAVRLHDAVGAVLAIHSGASAVLSLALPLGGLIGAALSTGLMLGLAGRRTDTLGLILAGVAVASLSGALTTLALNLAPNPFASIEIVFWMLGSLTDRSVLHLGLAAPFILVGLALLLTTASGLDALTLGEDAAANLGVNLPRLRLTVIAGTALSVGAATAVAGGIGFVGLIVPHLLRPLVGHRPGRLLAASALGGAALLLAADIAVRLIGRYGDVRLGVVTALIGAPFFIWLVIVRPRETLS
jgi:iron complex transport system permease protein